MDKLSEIMEWKRREIADRVRVVEDSELAAFGAIRPQGRFLEALQTPSGLAVISEIKRRSPSAGQIKALGASTEQAETYLSAGADCLSILTDEKYFGGNLSDLESVTQKFAQEQALNIGWLDAVVNLEKELDRNLFHNTDFVINVDTKWSTHAEPLSIDPAVRKTWHKAKWTNDLYLLAIVKDATFKSIRDLQGESGATLCENMRDALRDVALQVYGVPPSQLRIMFHYHPQYYRLHAHCVRIHAVNPGSETERAHLLTTVAFNLRMNANYYKQATLSYKVRAGERLHRLLVDNDNIGLV